jgi:hypothetical protein
MGSKPIRKTRGIAARPVGDEGFDETVNVFVFWRWEVENRQFRRLYDLFDKYSKTPYNSDYVRAGHILQSVVSYYSIGYI